jgi:hypothetical protein
MESILTSIKKLLLVPEEYEQFDADIIMHINSAFMNLTQLGVGPSEGFYIADEKDTWDEFIDFKNNPQMSFVKTYVAKKVQTLFDPPTSSVHMNALNAIISELEWRLNVAAESK